MPPPAEPEVIASIVSYLARREAYFITGWSISGVSGVRCDGLILFLGQTISVNGGVFFD